MRPTLGACMALTSGVRSGRRPPTPAGSRLQRRARQPSRTRAVEPSATGPRALSPAGRRAHRHRQACAHPILRACERTPPMVATMQPPETLDIPLEDAREATVRIGFGGGELTVREAPPGTLVSGTFQGGVVQRWIAP